jgi:hypothetical protein
MAQKGKLSNNESRDFTDFFRFSYKDLKTTGFLSTIGAANQVKIGSLPSGGAVTNVTLTQITDPVGATDLTADVGWTGADPDELIDALDVDALTKAVYNTGDGFTGEAGTTDPVGVTNAAVNNTASAVDILLEFNGTVGSLTAGEWVIAWAQCDPGRLGINPVS